MVFAAHRVGSVPKHNNPHMDHDANLNSFPQGFRALVIGSSGGIGAAFVHCLQNNPRCAQVLGLHRHSVPAIDLDLEASMAQAAAQLASGARFHLIVHAAGVLHTPQYMPEKKLSDLNYGQLMDTFRTNTFGPALVLRHFTPLLDSQRGVMAVLSAKVGSIGDNRLGGWYSYRASKAALNMVVKTASIEVKRSNPAAVLVALHPGTVHSRLSQPFRGSGTARSAEDAATDMLGVLDRLTPADTGQFLAYNGAQLPW
jgi:NAD(P)-dependent dehydrogenase (short-subunit alcohol dehydrogenase family)